jgi:hypothetical protein
LFNRCQVVAGFFDEITEDPLLCFFIHGRRPFLQPTGMHQ